MTTQIKSKIERLYEEDFFLWLEETMKHLQNRDSDNLDWTHLLEEIEALGKEQKHKVESYLKQLLKHLLIYQHWQSQRSYCGRDWQEEINNFRDELEFLLRSKTLDNYLVEKLPIVYLKARKQAIIKSDLSPAIFPETCPYKVEQILDVDFLPDN